MAYKYSKGAFTASGSITAEEGLSSLTTLSASSTLQVGGASTLQGVTATTVSGTTSQFTSVTAISLAGDAVSGISINSVPIFSGGKFTNSLIISDPVNRNVALTSSAGAVTLQVSGAVTTSQAITAGNGLTVSAGNVAVSTGNVTVTSGFVSASTGLQAGGETALNNLTVNGNLTVLGTTISASVQNLIIEDKQIVLADGAANAAAAAGAGFFVSGANVEWTYKQNGEGTAISSGDIFVASGSSGLKAIQAKTFYGDVVGNTTFAVNTIGNADATLVTGVNYGSTDFTLTRTWTLPATPTTGSSVRIKGPGNLASSGTPGGYQLIVAAPAPYNIDNDATITLESPYAAIECVYVSGSRWSVF